MARTASRNARAPGERLDPVYNGLKRLDTETFALEDIEPVMHQHIVIRLIPRGAAEVVDPGTFGQFDPYFRRDHAFHVETYDFH